MVSCRGAGEGVWEIRSDTALALPRHTHLVLPKTATRKLQGDPGSAVPCPTVCSEALLSHEPSQQGLPGVPPGTLEGTLCGRTQEQMVQLGRVSERRGVTTQGLSSLGGGGEPFQIKVKGKGSQRRQEADDAQSGPTKETDVGTWANGDARVRAKLRIKREG